MPAIPFDAIGVAYCWSIEFCMCLCDNNVLLF